MKIELNEILIRDVFDGYVDSEENGVVGYGGKLNIRPAYQREFIYGNELRNAVIYTVIRDFPLNVMYWAKNNDGNFELLDGQQRTISICQYVNNEFSVVLDCLPRKFMNLTEAERDQILNYKLMIYFCEGTDKEKLEWFKIVNIAGLELKPQELRNAVYTGPWLTEAKKYFSRKQSPAVQIAKQYLSGEPSRQAYLETAIKWLSSLKKIEIEDYMSEHQYDTNCNELWLYFQAVINWVNATFPNYRKEMKGLAWGIFYNKYNPYNYDPSELERKVVQLMEDDDVTKNSGIYEYLLDGDEKHLNIRKFSDKTVRMTYEKQKGICPKCGKHFQINEMQADHITPWSKGGKTTAENCQMLCADCNRRKGNV